MKNCEAKGIYGMMCKETTAFAQKCVIEDYVFIHENAEDNRLMGDVPNALSTARSHCDNFNRGEYDGCLILDILRKRAQEVLDRVREQDSRIRRG